jgi:hypothetical protein
MKRMLAAAAALGLFALSQSALAADPYNYGTAWRQWSNEAKDAYLTGLSDGLARSYFHAAIHWLSKDENAKSPSTKRVEAVRERTILKFQNDALMPVITDLYRDPANAFVSWNEMAFVARDKLRGDSIDEELRRLRTNAVKWQEYLDQQKK